MNFVRNIGPEDCVSGVARRIRACKQVPVGPDDPHFRLMQFLKSPAPAGFRRMVCLESPKIAERQCLFDTVNAEIQPN